MPLELGIWRIDGEAPKAISKSSLDLEKRLEDILCKDIRIASPNWMLIGRQVKADSGQLIDLLAIDGDGALVVLELKRDKTPRDVVAQLFEYGSWVTRQGYEDIDEIYKEFQGNYLIGSKAASLDEAYKKHFGVAEMPETINSSHELVVVASSLDDRTERIISYLAEHHQVSINAVFFHVFKDDEREYLSRAWFIDPAEVVTAKENVSENNEPWNEEFYGSFSLESDRQWTDAKNYGFFSAGGGQWFSRTLNLLEPGKRIWVNIPGTVYVGVGTVEGPVQRADKFLVKQPDGSEALLSSMQLDATEMFKNQSDDTAQYVVPVKWIKTVDQDKAIKETGFFGNQNSVAKPVAKKWRHTVERLKVRFGVQ